MRECYVLEDVPEDELENVKDAMAVDGCKAKVERQPDGTYKVTAVCED